MRLPLFRLLTLPAVALAATAIAQDGYQMPPENIVRIAEAPPTPGISVSPDKVHVVLTHRESLIPLAELSRTELRIAGLRIDPAANAMSRRRMFRGLTLNALDGGAETAITGLPDPLRGDHLGWAPDGSRFAFTHTGDDGVELWTVDAGSGAATRVTSGVNAIFRNTPFHWLSDSAHLAVRIVDAGRGMPPEAPAVPETPVIQETTGRVAPARTYQDLLTSPHDNALFNYYGAARAVVVDLSGVATEIAGPGIIDRFAPSPDANYLLVSTIHEPFSWLVPYSRFPHRIEIRDRSGAVVREVANLPLHEEIPIGDYVLSGGEPAAVVLVDALVRLQPGALGSPQSTVDESFSAGLLEYPQYTRPPEFRGWRVPDVLLSGDHGTVERWRRERQIERTRARRPDLMSEDDDVSETTT